MHIRILFILSLLLLGNQLALAQKPKAKARKQTYQKDTRNAAPKNLDANGRKLTKMSLAPNVDVHLPSDFVMMPDEGIAAKYPSYKKPLAVYTSPNGHVDFIVTERKSDFPSNDLELLQKFYKASIMNMFTEVQFLSEKTERINGRNYVVLEFLSTMSQEKQSVRELNPVRKYTYIMYTVDDEKKKMTVFTLQAPAIYKETWENIAPNIMSSVRLK